jgi:glycosyltransferase involved in cell wall biosynthesis
VISIVIPTFNRKVLLNRALTSVFAQTYTDIEVIVVDDGSTDGTIEHITRHYPQVHLIQQAHHGVSHARNRGLRIARGEWIALLDSDDEWQADKLTRQMQALSAEPEYRVCHTDEIWIRHGKRVNPMKKHRKPSGWVFDACLPLCAISPSSILLHRDVLDEVGLFDEILPACEDYDLWLRIAARYPVLLLPKPLVIKHGGHADQLSRQHWGMDRFRIYALIKLLYQRELTPSQYQAALHVLNDKLTIYIQGSRKRQKHDELTLLDSIQCDLAGLVQNQRVVRMMTFELYEKVKQLVIT